MNEFLKHHDRDREQAIALLQQSVSVIGCGGVGSQVAARLAHAGAKVTTIDRDVLDPANLARHYLTNPSLVGQPKALALARELRSHLPAVQRFRGVHADVERLDDSALGEVLAGSSLFVDATGHNGVGRRLNRLARAFGVPLLVPSMWAGGPQQVVGDLHVVTWRGPRVSCFECLRPEASDEAAPAEAQPGSGLDVLRVATLTADVAVALLFAQAPQRASFVRQLNRGANFFLVTRWPPAARPVITRRRLDCWGCADRRPIVVSHSQQADSAQEQSVRDWIAGIGLASAALWHQLVPGLDYVATLAFITALGLWSRNRLPSFADVSTRVRALIGAGR